MADRPLSTHSEREVHPGMMIVERHHAYPWEPRMRGVVVALEPADLVVRWDNGTEQRVGKDRVGSKPTDLIQVIDRA